MFARIRNKKGNTLAELCVVMAIIAIVSTMVVSFCTLISAQTLTISKTNEIKEDNSLVKKQFDKFVEKYDSSDYQFVVSSVTETVNDETVDVKKLVVRYEEEVGVTEDSFIESFYVVKSETFADDNTSVKSYMMQEIGLDSSESEIETKIPLNFIKSADFEIKENDGKCLIICTLTYRDLKGKDQTVTYMKATRVAGAVSTQEDVE